MHVSTVQVIVFIYGIGLVLSCQIQDDLSLYYNRSNTRIKVVFIFVFTFFQQTGVERRIDITENLGSPAKITGFLGRSVRQ